MVLDTIDNIDFYKNFNKDIYDGLLFLSKVSTGIAVGEYPISPNVFARVLQYETKLDNGFGYEAHQHVIDIQFPIIGRELVKWSNLKNVKAYTDYDTIKDVTLFKATADESTTIIGNGIFGIFFPIDAHAPEYCVEMPELIKKVVIKIKC